MLQLIPAVKTLSLTGGALRKKAVFFDKPRYESRLQKALSHLPFDENGVELTMEIAHGDSEGYTIDVHTDSIHVCAQSAAAGFYAIQTLRQLFCHATVPCLHIADEPDFSYRGFYHDVTRGKVATVESIKEIIDLMAYYKLNSLQLYVEHVFPFAQCEKLVQKSGCLTPEELHEIDRYCQENFISFIPSLSTFGHMYELLQQEEYHHLRVIKDFQPCENFWTERMRHHTIDPLHPDSIKLVSSLIDQYYPHFTSDTFNICCDETFDLKTYPGDVDTGRLYVDFVKQIIDHVKGRGKKVMMWADILLQHPEVIDELPEDICFLNWKYIADPPEEIVSTFAKLGRPQIVCPGTTTWNRFCEDVDVEEQNISKMALYGYRYGALGVLNTNWGDWGNPCSVELAMYGLVLGAEKSWSVNTPIDHAFYSAVDTLLYGKEGAMALLKKTSRLQSNILWKDFVRCYLYNRYGYKEVEFPAELSNVQKIQKDYIPLRDALEAQTWGQDEIRQEMAIAAEGVCLMAELYAKLQGQPVQRLTNANNWCEKYAAKWRSKNKESELHNITDMFLYCEAL